MRWLASGAIAVVFLCALSWSEDASLQPRLLQTIQIGVPQAITVEQIRSIVENPKATYLEVMLARSALVVLRQDDPQWEKFENLLSSVLNSSLSSGNEYPQPAGLQAGYGGKELVFTMVYAMVMSGEQESATSILEQHLDGGSRLNQAVALQALRNIGTQRAINLIQKYQEKGDYHNLAENTLADQDYPVLSELYARWNVFPQTARTRDNLLKIVQSGCGEREAMAAYWLGFFSANPDSTRERTELSALKTLYGNNNPQCDFMARLIAIKALGLRSAESMDYWTELLHKEPNAWLRHQILINAFGHYGAKFAPAALDLLATEPSQYIQWQLMQGNIEWRQGQRFRSYWDIWIPVTLQFLLVFPDPGHQDKMSATDQDQMLRWLESDHRPQDRVVFNHMIYCLLSQTRDRNTRRLLVLFNNLPDRNKNWWMLMPLEDESALPLLNFYLTLPAPSDQKQELAGVIENLQRRNNAPHKPATCCEPTQECLRSRLEEGSFSQVKITSEQSARAWLKGILVSASEYQIHFSGPLGHSAIAHRAGSPDQHWEYLYDCWRRTDADVPEQPARN